MHSELLARLEAATGPDRELDNALMMIQHDWKRRKLSAVANHRVWCWVNRETNRWRTTARDGFTFTASIDAALTLRPSGALYAIETYDSNGVYPEHIRASAWVQGAARAFAATPALAIVIAALRAIEARQQ